MPCLTKQQATYVERSATDWKHVCVAGELLASLNRATGVGLHSLAIAQPGPPGYVCANAAGARVALDVDAVVCKEAAEDDSLERVLHAGALAAHLARLLAEKDGNAYQGGPYSEVVAVLVIDEPTLRLEQAVFELASVAFGPYRQLTSVYLLLPYDSSTMSRPAVPVQLRR